MVINYPCLYCAQIRAVGRSLWEGYELLVEHHLVYVVFEYLAGVVVVEGRLVGIVLEGEMVLWLCCSFQIIADL